MSDPRLTPDKTRITARDPARVCIPVADLCRSPDGPRDRQLLFGDDVVAFGSKDGWTYVQAEKDGYCGFVKEAELGARGGTTHRVCAPATHVYARADFKSQDRMSLSFGSRMAVIEAQESFARTDDGFVPLTHLEPLDARSRDPAEIAALFLGTPYLWGGNSRWGIDCSGLVQAALLTCGIACPGDSDQQEALGEAASDAYQRNDLLFWKGHVALVVDEATLIHANAGSMSTRYEGITAAISRIKAQGDGPVTAHRRIPAG